MLHTQVKAFVYGEEVKGTPWEGDPYFGNVTAMRQDFVNLGGGYWKGGLGKGRTQD